MYVFVAKPYLRTFSVQTSATEGARRIRQDRELGEAIKKAAEAGPIDVGTLDREVVPHFKDAGRVAKSESGLVDLLDKARDGRRKAQIDGVRIRMTPEAERRFVHHRSQLEAKLAPAPGLSEAQYGVAATASIAAWYRAAVTEAWADIEVDDEEMFSVAARDRDLALADRLRFGGAPGALLTVRAAAPEDVEFYRNRAFFTAGGDPVPSAQVWLHRIEHEPEYAGQVLTSLLAMDRRDGALLAHLWTTD